MKRTTRWALGFVVAGALWPATTGAQDLSAEATDSEAVADPVGPATAVDITTFVEAAPTAEPDSGKTSGAGRFVRDVLSDYKNFFSVETAVWLSIGGGAALGVHQADHSIANWAQTTTPSLPGGTYYGSQAVQIPVAIIWWIAGSAAGSENQASTGRDLLRAQLSVASWTYAFKFATNRTRPNGMPRSFPSGHASTSFAIAAVLEEHFGWKAGLPALLAAAYTGVSRIAQNEHWASDVVFGAALGMAAGRTVTIRLRNTKVSVAPVSVPKGGGILLTVLR